MTMQIRKAERRKAKLRLGIVGASGSGKTYTALLLALGLGGKIGLIDTEHGSGELYADLGNYDVISLQAPYEAQKYLDAIKAFETAKYDVIIIDSLTHAWAGEGGLLDKQGSLEASGRYKNSFATWRDITPLHNKLIEAMLKSPAHIIGTMRSKQEYVLEQNDKGKAIPRKVGMAPVQRDGMDYEFTVVFDLSDTHYAKTSKDRTGLFDSKNFIPGVETGKMLAAWLNSGADALPPPAKPSPADQLNDEIPEFTTPAVVDIEDQAKAYAEFIKGALTIEEFEHEILQHAELMAKLAMQKPAYHTRLLELIVQKRADFLRPAPSPRKKKAVKPIDDNGELNDPLPESMQPEKSQAEQLTEQLKGAA